MAENMNFPKKPMEFLRSYEFPDTDEIYTNGANLIPSFRVEQMIEHYLKIDNVDTANVTHGKWERSKFTCAGGGLSNYNCSYCDALMTIRDCEPKTKFYKYCPNCGTKMDLKEE